MNQKLIPADHRYRVNDVVEALERAQEFLAEATTDYFLMSNSDYGQEMLRVEAHARLALSKFNEKYGKRL